jgi:DMSO/TMAO reductase YedYZ heme-binding membrane subunit
VINNLINYFVNAVNRTTKEFILYLAGSVILIMVIWGGLQYIQGNAEGGKKTITSAIIGAAIIALAIVIINTVNHLLFNN